MFVFPFLIAALSMAIPMASTASNCTVCKLGAEFTDANGYGCFPLSNGRTACTCPDKRYTLDKPCRICERENICGANRDNYCSEAFNSSLDVQGANTGFFGCFCTNSMFYVGQACPAPATTTTTTRVSVTVPISLTTTTTAIPVANNEADLST